MSITIHSVQGNFRSNMAQIAADIAGVELKTNFFGWKDLKSKENLARNAQGQVPTLETPEGFIAQTNTILTYIASVAKKGNLLGTNDFERAQVDQFLDFAQTELLKAIVPLLLHLWGYKNASAEEIKEARANTEKLLEYLNNILKKQEFFVKSGLTLADIAIHSVLVYAYRHIFGEEIRCKYANLISWYECISAEKEVQKVYGQSRFSSQPWF